MRIIITENQKYILRRLNQFIEIAEEQIEGYDLNDDDSWWCRYYNPDSFLEHLIEQSIEEFINQNWEFFHDDSDKGGSDMDISFLNRIFDENYGNYVKNLFVRKCNQSRR